MKHRVLFLIGSESDRKIAEQSFPYYEYFEIKVELIVSSAHRNPGDTVELARSARKNGFSAIVCGAGMAAHLAGVCAGNSDLPVIGVPLSGGILDGLDALLSTVQMPKGVPVATLAVGKSGAINSAVLCARILSLTSEEIHNRLTRFIENGSNIPRDE